MHLNPFVCLSLPHQIGSLNGLEEEISVPHSASSPLCNKYFLHMLDGEPLGQCRRSRVVVRLYKPRAIVWAQGLFLARVSFPLGASAGRLFCLFLFSFSFLFWVVQSMDAECPADALFPLGFYRTFREPIPPFHMIGSGLERKEVRFLGR